MGPFLDFKPNLHLQTSLHQTLNDPSYLRHSRLYPPLERPGPHLLTPSIERVTWLQRPSTNVHIHTRVHVSTNIKRITSYRVGSTNVERNKWMTKSVYFSTYSFTFYNTSLTRDYIVNVTLFKCRRFVRSDVLVDTSQRSPRHTSSKDFLQRPPVTSHPDLTS